MRAEQSWSLLDTKPVMLYIEKCDEYLVYWNGVVMPHKMSLCMAMEYASGIYTRTQAACPGSPRLV